MIAIIDYGAGNANSVKNALNFLGFKSIITEKAKLVGNAEKIILPGVGSFGFMMSQLRKKGLDDLIIKVIENRKPFFGICLGLQVLFEESEESKGIQGLGIFRGKAVMFKNSKIPQIGWNKVIPLKNGIFIEDYFYFVNSYHVIPQDKSIISAKSDYFGEFVSSIRHENIIATQFHPEKSGSPGLELFRRWLKC